MLRDQYVWGYVVPSSRSGQRSRYNTGTQLGVKCIRDLSLPANCLCVTFSKERILERLMTIIFLHTLYNYFTYNNKQ
jgi:hypothetical protein